MKISNIDCICSFVSPNSKEIFRTHCYLTFGFIHFFLFVLHERCTNRETCVSVCRHTVAVAIGDEKWPNGVKVVPLRDGNATRISVPRKKNAEKKRSCSHFIIWTKWTHYYHKLCVFFSRSLLGKGKERQSKIRKETIIYLLWWTNIIIVSI